MTGTQTARMGAGEPAARWDAERQRWERPPLEGPVEAPGPGTPWLGVAGLATAVLVAGTMPLVGPAESGSTLAGDGNPSGGWDGDPGGTDSGDTDLPPTADGDPAADPGGAGVPDPRDGDGGPDTDAAADAPAGDDGPADTEDPGGGEDGPDAPSASPSAGTPAADGAAFTLDGFEEWERADDGDSAAVFTAPDGGPLWLRVVWADDPAAAPLGVLTESFAAETRLRDGYEEVLLTEEEEPPPDEVAYEYLLRPEDGPGERGLATVLTADDGRVYALLAAGPDAEEDRPEIERALLDAVEGFRLDGAE